MMITKGLKFTLVLSIIVVAGTTVGLFITSSPVPDAETVTSLNVMTYNIYQGYTPEGGINLELIRDTISSFGPDIVGLQESDMNRISSMNIDSIRWLATELKMHSYFGPPTSEGIIGVALLSRYPITSATYHLMTSEELPRVLIEATILVGTTEVNVFVVHLGLSYEDRTTQTSEVLQFVNAASAPKILMGDFNTLPTGEPEPSANDTRTDTIYQDITTYLNDTWTAVGNPLNPENGFTWPSNDPIERIDYIFVSPDLSVAFCDVIRFAAGSDHLPVVASIELP